MLKQVQTSDDLDLLVVRLTLDNAADLDARLPDAIRLSALPRTLDPDVLGMLRGDSDRNTSEHLLSLMLDLGLVSGPPNKLSFHEVTRNALLRDWHQSGPERALQLTQLNASLRDYYDARLDELMRLGAEFKLVSRPIRKANSRRWGRLNTELESRISVAAREAAYHGFMVSPDEGMSVVTSRFETLTAAGRITVAERLINEARDQLMPLPVDEAQLERQALVRYFAGWLARQVEPDPHKAETIAREAVDDKHLPGRYRLWAMDDLARKFEEQVELSRALPLRIKLAQHVHEEDPWNAPLWAFSLGSLRWRLLERDQAVAAMKQSLAAAEQPECRSDLRLAALSTMAQLQLELGDIGAAGLAITEALHLARTEFADDRGNNRVMAQCFSYLLARFDARASEAAFSEAFWLAEDGSTERMDVLFLRLNLLWDLGASGRIAIIERLLTELYLEDGESESEPGDREYLLGVAAEAHGRFDEADGHFSFAQDKSKGANRAVNQIDALMGRIRCTLRLGRWNDVEHCARQLRPLLKKTGSSVRLALLDIYLAQLSLSLGDLSESAALLAKADSRLPHGHTGERWRYLQALTDLQLRKAEYANAADTCQQALSSERSRRDQTGQVKVLRSLIRIAEEQYDWNGHSALVQELQTVSSRVQAECLFTFSSDELNGQRRNVNGMRELTNPDSNREDALLAARSHLEAAVAHDPGCFWYRLNLSYVLADQTEWARAVAELERGLSQMPEEFRARRLMQQLAELSFEEALVSAVESPADALHRLTARLGAVADELPETQRRRLAVAGTTLAAICGDSARILEMANLMGPPSEVPTEDVREVVMRCLALRHDGQRLWTPGLYWNVVNQLASARDQAGADASTNLTLVEAALEPYLSDWFGLHDVTRHYSYPSPLRLEVAHDLRPLVDDSLDNGRFLFSLLPEMRERIRNDTGIVVPGVRVRLGDLPSRWYRILVNEVEVDRGELTGDGLMMRLYRHPEDAEAELLPRHPRNGDYGPWVLAPPDQHVDPAQLLQPEQVLLARLDWQLTQHLDLLATVDNVLELLRNAYREGIVDEPTMDALLADEKTWARLTWLVQELLRDGVPIRFGPLITTVFESGGLETETPHLASAVRRALRNELPGNEPNREVRRLAKEFADSARLSDRGPYGERLRTRYRNQLRIALRETGPWLTLIAPSKASRGPLAVLTRAEEPLVAVLAEDEVNK